MLSISYESLFVFLFGILLFIYVRFEFYEFKDAEFFQTNLNKNVQSINEPTEIDEAFSFKEWRRALILLAFIEIAFFGTGNVASLNSFNPTFIRNFITVFSPFVMASLLMFKIFVPFAFVAYGFTSILHLDERMFSRLCVLLLIITNFLSLAFFFLLKDQGSWLEIGISISNYIISMTASSVMFLLLRIANRLMVLSLKDHIMKMFYFVLIQQLEVHTIFAAAGSLTL
uniref:GPI ethanolamine phosphate transferase 1 n=1 Tax=Acrobeloides nanus TaxID=290746 RepID=A0A914EDG9_9BILA